MIPCPAVERGVQPQFLGGAQEETLGSFVVVGQEHGAPGAVGLHHLVTERPQLRQVRPLGGGLAVVRDEVEPHDVAGARAQGLNGFERAVEGGRLDHPVNRQAQQVAFHEHPQLY